MTLEFLDWEGLQKMDREIRDEVVGESGQTTADREFILGLYSLMKWEAHKDVETRNVVITPYLGNYGMRAGHVIAIEGSPPKGLVFVASRNCVIIYGGGEKVKVLHRFHSNKMSRELDFIVDYLKLRGYRPSSQY